MYATVEIIANNEVEALTIARSLEGFRVDERSIVLTRDGWYSATGFAENPVTDPRVHRFWVSQSPSG